MTLQPASPLPEHVDVLVLGAGISGIGAAYYLQREHPARSYVILEARGAIGGTWDLFRYPGIRSDSDLHTFGYAFKPWVDDKAIAGAPAILAYLREVVAENGIDRKIRFGHKVVRAAWSSAEARWRVTVVREGSPEPLEITCAFLFCAGGYYRYDEGHSPHFPGSERFQGRIVHPQAWPEGLDYAGKRVVVIGSGATAVTVVPAMAEKAGHVIMLQRTPTYLVPLPSEDAVANLLKKLLPAERAYALTRKKNIARQRAVYTFCQRHPRLARRLFRFLNARSLPRGYPVDEHFNPPYDPWDQRLCVVTDGDLFQAIRDGRASVVTDRIVTFTERGIALASGREMVCDLIVTATGLNLLPFGGIGLTVDGAEVRVPEKVAYKGMMLDGVPNFAFAIGYTNSSWTLKVDLVCEHLCRLLTYMDEHGHAVVRPERPAGMATRPILDFGAGYVKRAMHLFPRQGAEEPWTMSMSYPHDVALLRDGPVQDRGLRFSPRPATGGVR